MAKFTVQVEYLMPVYQHVQVEAKNIKEACEKALEIAADDWSRAEHDYDGSTATYITGVVRGHFDNIYEPGAKGCKFAITYGRKPVVKELLT